MITDTLMMVAMAATPGMGPAADALPPAAAADGTTIRNLLPAAMMLLAVVLIMGSILRRKPLKKVGGHAERAAHEDWADTKERLNDIRSAARGRDSLDNVVADCEELAQRMATMMEAKAARLEALIADADERLARLEQAGQPAPRSTGSPDRRGASAHDDHQTDLSHHAASTEERSASRLSSSKSASPAAASSAGDEARNGYSDGFSDVRDRVYALADQGLSAVEIAQHIEQPTGQIELMLALRRV